MARVVVRVSLLVMLLAALPFAAITSGRTHGEAGGLPALAARAPGAPAAAAATGAADVTGPVVVVPAGSDVSPALRDVVATTSTDSPQLLRPPFEPPRLTRPSAYAPFIDPVAQTELAPAAMPPVLSSFEGLSNETNLSVGRSRWVPPDTTGEAGPNEYVQTVSFAWAVFDKTTGLPKTGFPKADKAIWSGFNTGAGPTCRDNPQGDTTVLYDETANRWLIGEFAFPFDGNGQATTPFVLCVAVSRTGDPSGAYARYAYKFDRVAGGRTTSIFPDYAKFGVWPNGYYMSMLEFDPGGSYEGVGAVAFDRTAMLAAAASPKSVWFELLGNQPGLLPADAEGTLLPPGDAPNVFLQYEDDGSGAPADRLKVWKFHADFVGATSTFTQTAALPAAAFDSTLCAANANGIPDCVPQPGTTTRLDAMSDRLMYRLQYRRLANGQQSLVLNHTVGVDGTGRAGIRWYELRLDDSFDPSIFQQGTYAPADGGHRWMASAAMDGSGNIAVGFDVSAASSTFPSLRYAGRLAGDTAGQLAQGEATLRAGGGSQIDGTVFGPGGENRWGDYSALQVDPVDGCTFWYTSEYYAATDTWRWRTRIGSFKFASCGPPTAVAVAGLASRRTREGVELRWRTRSERRILGFHVWRSGANGWRRLDRTLIAAKRAGANRGAAYRYLDRSRRLATYRLQVVDLDAQRSWYAVGTTP